MPIMTTIFTNTNTAISQQYTGSTTEHHTSCVSSVKATTTSVGSIVQAPQGMLTCSVCIVSLNCVLVIESFSNVSLCVCMEGTCLV